MVVFIETKPQEYRIGEQIALHTPNGQKSGSLWGVYSNGILLQEDSTIRNYSINARSTFQNLFF